VQGVLLTEAVQLEVFCHVLTVFCMGLEMYDDDRVIRVCGASSLSLKVQTANFLYKKATRDGGGLAACALDAADEQPSAREQASVHAVQIGAGRVLQHGHGDDSVCTLSFAASCPLVAARFSQSRLAAGLQQKRRDL
jgi:hypothetical protein